MSERSIDTKAEKLCDIIMKTGEFWETKNKAILLLIDLVLPYENQPEDLIEEVFSAEFFRLIKEPVKSMVCLPLRLLCSHSAPQICDLRSQQVRDICNLLSVVSQIAGDRMKLFLRDAFNCILDGIKVPNKVMSGYVDECILLIITNVTFKSAIPLIVTEVKECKAKYVRERCMDYINEILINWEVGDREADSMCEAIRSGLEDASVKCREIARSAYMNMFQRFPKKTEKVKNALTASTLKVKLSTAESELGLTTSNTTVESGVVSNSNPPSNPPSNPTSEKVQRPAPSTVTKAPPVHKEPQPQPTPSVSRHHKAEKDDPPPPPRTVTKEPRIVPREKRELPAVPVVPPAPAPVAAAVPAPVVPPVAAAAPAFSSKASTAAYRQSIRRRSMVPNPFESLTNFSSSIELDDSDADVTKSSPSKSVATLSPSSAAGSPNRNSKQPKGFEPSPTKKAPTPVVLLETTLVDHSASFSSSDSRNSVSVGAAPAKTIVVDMMVKVSRGKDPSANGIVRFVGKTLFAAGVWIGVELFTDVGKNNGSVQGEAYFVCPPNRGLFVKEENVEPLPSEKSSPNAAFGKPPASPGKRLTNDNIGDEIRSALSVTSSFVKPTTANGLPPASPRQTIIHGHVSCVTEANGLEKRNQLKCVLKLKVSQLLATLNNQMEIVKRLEDEDKAGAPFSLDAYHGIMDEIVDFTSQELELIHSFKGSLASQQLF